jgi:hypothetical protein
VHATDATAHVELDDDPEEEWRFAADPNTDRVANTSKFAAMLLLNIVWIVNEQLGLKLNERKQKLFTDVEGMRDVFSKSVIGLSPLR